MPLRFCARRFPPKRNCCAALPRREWMIMHHTTETKPTTGRQRPEMTSAANLTNAAKSAPRKSDPNWKPEPCGLTRAELRKIVADILG
ncbi:hypothetical protein [Bosea sp. OK403]|uniref:hypothetical protein n=1 Tax=Bosea sp. OK403 TaxID=1855286 RepID=UPI00111399E6|nr:hypothetical protein [Bosea sp. OK403]